MIGLMVEEGDVTMALTTSCSLKINLKYRPRDQVYRYFFMVLMAQGCTTKGTKPEVVKNRALPETWR